MNSPLNISLILIIVIIVFTGHALSNFLSSCFSFVRVEVNKRLDKDKFTPTPTDTRSYMLSKLISSVIELFVAILIVFSIVYLYSEVMELPPGTSSLTKIDGSDVPIETDIPPIAMRF